MKTLLILSMVLFPCLMWAQSTDSANPSPNPAASTSATRDSTPASTADESASMARRYGLPVVKPSIYVEQTLEDDIFDLKFWEATSYKFTSVPSGAEWFVQMCEFEGDFPKINNGQIVDGTEHWNVQGMPDFSTAKPPSPPRYIWKDVPWPDIRLIHNDSGLYSLSIIFYRTDEIGSVGKRSKYTVDPKKTNDLFNKVVENMEEKLHVRATPETRGFGDFVWNGKVLRFNGIVWWVIEQPGRFVVMQAFREENYTKDFRIWPGATKAVLKQRIQAKAAAQNPRYYQCWMHFSSTDAREGDMLSPALVVMTDMNLMPTVLIAQQILFNCGFDIPEPLVSHAIGITTQSWASDQDWVNGVKGIVSYNGYNVQVLASGKKEARHMDKHLYVQKLNEGAQITLGESGSGYGGHYTSMLGYNEKANTLLFSTFYNKIEERNRIKKENLHLYFDRVTIIE